MAIEKGKRRRMKDLVVKEISIVDAPANGRRFLLLKSEKGGDGMRVKKIEVNASDEVEILSIESFEKGLNTLASTLAEGFQNAIKGMTDEVQSISKSIKEVCEKTDAFKTVLESRSDADGKAILEKLALQLADVGESVKKLVEKSEGKGLDEGTIVLAESLLTQEEVDAFVASANKGGEK